MSMKINRFRQLGRVMRHIAATLAVAAGIYYLIQPPVTTIGFFDAEWPPMLWGGIMVIGGLAIAWGLISKIMQLEQTGMLLFGVGSLMLALTQTLVMFTPPVSHTRGGGTFVLWALVAFTSARYLELAAEIRSSRLADEKLSARADG